MSYQELRLDIQSRDTNNIRRNWQALTLWSQQFPIAGGGTSLTVMEVDATPTVADVITIRFASPATVVDNGGGDVTVTPIPGGTPPCLLVQNPTGGWVTLTPDDPDNEDYSLYWDHTTQTWKLIEVTMDFPCPPEDP